MTFKNIVSHPECMPEIKRVYKEAFPFQERAPLFYLRQKAKEDNFDFFAIYDEDKFVGLTNIIYYKDIVFIFYLAVAEEVRGKGYGSKILADITVRYPKKRIILNMERLDKNASNYEQQLQRKKFYNRNGFMECGVRTIEFGMRYEMMAYSGKVPYKEFAEMMREYLGNTLFVLLYKVDMD